jgi:uncharacterized protein with FMN-binding domain
MKLKKSLIRPLGALLILALSIAWYLASGNGDHVGSMKRLVPQATQFLPMQNGIYKAVGKNGDGSAQTLGYIANEQATGYAGPITVMVFIDPEGSLKNLLVVENVESPAFFLRVMAADFPDQFKGKRANSPFSLEDDLDAISRATFTSRGIAEAARKAAHKIAAQEFKLELPPAPRFHFSYEHIAILGLLVLVPALHRLKLAKTRYLTLLAGFLLIGLWQKSPLSLSNISSVLGGNIPSLAEIPFWLILLAGVLFYVVALGRNLYCFWLCPMGAIAEGCAKAGEYGKLTMAPRSRQLQKYKRLRLILAWLALVLGFATLGPSASSYEIFAPLFALQGNKAQWLMLPFFLFLGVFITRFWCGYFCPVGGILDALVKFRTDAIKWLRTKKAD